MVRQNWYVRQILTSLTLAMMLAVSGVAQTALTEADIDNLSPSELHQMLAERKALQLQKARQIRTMSGEDTKAPDAQTNFDVTFYDIWMRINDTIDVVYGKNSIYAEAAEAGVTSVDIDLYSNMLVDSIVAPGGQLTYSRSGNVVTVNLDQAYNTGEAFQFDFWYHGTPATGGFQAFDFGTHNGDPAITTLSEPYFARTWWPCKDRMDDKPDSMRSHIEVDTSLYCASNGTLDSITTAAANSRTFHYRMDYPIVTYLFSLAIHPYVVWEQDYVYNGGADTMPVIHHVYPDWDAYSRPRWGLTPDILAALAANYGEYPFTAHNYGHANFNWGGGMEHQTMSSMGASSFGFSESIIAHEAAHQWWGDMITCESWQDIWLNEGWASYSEALWQLENNGWAAYHNYMDGMAYYGGGTVWVEPEDTNSVWSIFNGNLSYDKGAWVVHMLRGVLGDSLFSVGVDAYYNSEHQHGSATTEDFKYVWENATGVELDWFFDDWIYGQYYPRYEFQFLSESSGGGQYTTYLYVTQVQSTQPRVFDMPVDFFVDYSGATDDTLTFVHDAAEKLFKFTSAAPVVAMELDPADWILKTASQESWTLHFVTFPEEVADGLVGEAYEDTIQYRGGTGSGYDVSVTGGSLPPGLAIDDDGIVTGTPQADGEYTFDLLVVNSGSGYGAQG
ncbi:hypothetical protein GF377_08175, partial [candidate division GN15 bacterium]|nr:hypothetical protein [candidate division GN15 bacterium]